MVLENGGEKMDVKERLRQLMDERGWSYYRLAVNSGLSDSTIANIIRRDALPSIPTLEAICAGLGISMAQFFSDGEEVHLTDDLQELFAAWLFLTPEQKSLLLQFLKTMHRE